MCEGGAGASSASARVAKSVAMPATRQMRNDETTRATVEALRASGQMPQRGQGGGPGRPPGEGGIIVEGGPGGGFVPGGGDPSAMQTAVAENGGSRGARLGLNSELLQAIITFLEGKIQ